MDNDNPYATPATGVDMPSANNRRKIFPTLAKALAIIAICIGIFNILGGLCGVIAMGGSMAVLSNPQIQQDMARQDPEEAARLQRQVAQMKNMMPLYIAQGAVSVLLAIGLISGGIGTLGQSAWGRKTLVVSSGLSVLAGLVGMGFTIYTMMFQDAMTEQEKLGATAGAIIGSAIGLIFIAYYAYTMIYFTRVDIRQHFED